MHSVKLEKLNILRRTKVAAGIVFVSGCAAGLWWADRVTNTAQPQSAQTFQNGIQSPPSPELQIYKPLQPEEAKEENEKLPFSTAPIERALPLILPSSDTLLVGRRNAADCLTSAIYYEAGNEPGQGQRAVAQVILNRVRHPAYPKSICGVVYQGSERRTGCQFTFTCDGSLARKPARDRWEQARRVAISAITGAVEPSVGMATHYHANYVMPYWAPSLDKVSQIGTHIFYRWKGSWGQRRAFSQVVQLDSAETILATAIDILPVAEDKMPIQPVPEKLASRIIADERTPTTSLFLPSSEINAPNLPKIQADAAGSQLLIDDK